MSKSGQQQRPIIHPKLRGKLENWQRSQAALAAANQHDGATGSGSVEAGDSKSGEFHGNGCLCV